MLKWGEEELKKKTFPRDDYKELLELVVVGLGGKVEDFVFKLPGPDHHARWMAKGLYNSKMKLLRKVFKLSAEEQRQVDQLSEFVWLFYAKLWFTTPLPCSAARHDLNFMSSILEYRSVNSKLCYEVLRSAYRHLWYLTPQLITLSLFDSGLEDKNKEGIARMLHCQERGEISTGKPIFPLLEFGATAARNDMSSLVGPESWLLFDLFDITGPQDWLLTPASTWHFSPVFIELQEHANNLVVINDLAERGCHLATEFINRVDSEEQRQALFQVVENNRAMVKNTNKSSLKLC